MVTLDQILLRLPRKVPDADFVDKLFGQIHGTSAPQRLPRIHNSIKIYFYLESEWIEPVQSTMQEDVRIHADRCQPSSATGDAKRVPSPDIYRVAELSLPNLNRFSP